MAESVQFEDPKPDLKRKRQSSDEGAMRPTPGYQRTDGANSSGHDQDSAASFLGQAGEDMQQSSSGLDMGGLPHPGPSNSNASDTAAAALSHAYMSVPQSTELSFAANGGNNQDVRREGFDDHLRSQLTGANVGQQAQSPPSADGTPGAKPAVGSDEWHRQRRDNHKEVERRRRETINEGINELAKIVPGCEKNKGSILQNAVRFITQLKENENSNIEKWTLEKLLTEQAISELSQSCDKFKAEVQRAWGEVETQKNKNKIAENENKLLREACEKAGVLPDELKNANQSSEGASNGDS